MVNLAHSFFFYFRRASFAFRFYFYQLTLFFNQENQETGCQILTEPEILLLDEPTAGMDALSRRQMWNLLRKLNGKNLTILLTTHYMEEAQNLCSRVALMDHGKLEEINTPSGLIDSLGRYAVDVFSGEETRSSYFNSREEAIAYLSGLSGQASLRETTLEDVFVERAGRHLMPS